MDWQKRGGRWLTWVCVVSGLALGSGWWVWSTLAWSAEPSELISLPGDTPPPPEGYRSETTLKLAYALGQLDLLDVAGPPLPPEVEERKDVEYGRVGDRALQADLYLPKKLEKPTPGLIFVHGGGWKGGKRADYRVYTIDFAKRGYVVATITYRLAQEAKFPAALEDAKCAVRWMRSQAAALHVDPQRIAILGGSYWYDRLTGWPHTMDLARPINERSQLLINKFLEAQFGPRQP